MSSGSHKTETGKGMILATDRMWFHISFPQNYIYPARLFENVDS